MAYHKPLTEEQYQKMIDLREAGLSNSQIALDLGVCYQSVRRFLGKQPDMSRASYGSLKTHATGEKFERPATKPQSIIPEDESRISGLRLVSSVATFEGSMFTYRFHVEKSIIHISDDQGIAFELTKAQFQSFLSEMKDLSAFLDSAKFA